MLRSTGDIQNFNQLPLQQPVPSTQYATHSLKLMTHPQSVGPMETEESAKKNHLIMPSYGQEALDTMGGPQQESQLEERLNIVNTSSYLGGGEGSSGSSIIIAGNMSQQPVKPTHRRKKSQQPTLMTTKQKQSQPPPGNVSSQSVVQGGSNGGQGLSIEHSRDNLASLPNVVKPDEEYIDMPLFREHQRTGIYQEPQLNHMPQFESAYRVNEEGAVQNSNLNKETPQPPSEVKAPFSPNMQGFSALSQIRERVHSIGFVDLSSAANSRLDFKNDLPQKLSAQIKADSNQAEKNNKVQKQSEAAQPVRMERSQYSVQILGAMGSNPTRTQSHVVSGPSHKRNQTKNLHYPLGSSGLLQHPKLNLQSEKPTKDHKSQQMRFSDSQHDRLRYPEALAKNHHGSKLSNERAAKSSAEPKDMIKQLMKKHFVAPSSTLAPTIQLRQEDAKAAYLRHAEESGNSQQKRVETKEQFNEPNQYPAQSSIKDEVSPARSSIMGGNGTSKIQNNSKRVTFNAPSSHNQSEEQSNDDMQPNWLSSNENGGDRKRPSHRRSNHSINPQKFSGDVDFQDFDYYQDQEDYGREEDEGNQDSYQSGEHLESMQQEPTVVIDSSIEDNAVVNAQYLRMADGDLIPQAFSSGNGTSTLLQGANTSGGIIEKASGHPKAQSLLALDNIQAALMSIRQQEDEERTNYQQFHDERAPNQAALMTQEEEEALISQINEIRDRIRRGETAGQKQQLPAHERKSTIDYETEPYRSNILEKHPSVEYGSGLRMVPQTVRPPLYQNGSDFKEANIDGYGKSSSPAQVKSTEKRHNRQRSYHSIDNVNCMIVTDGPNVYEKKRQRYEKIQKMRGVTTTSATIGSGEHGAYGTIVPQDQEGISSRYHGSREGNTPMAHGETSSCISGNYASLLKNIPSQSKATDPKKKGAVVRAKKQSSQSKTKSISQKSVLKQAPQSQLKRVSGSGQGKSRQNSTVDQIAQAITSHSQQYKPMQQVYHSSSKSGGYPLNSGGLIKGGGKERSSSSGKKDKTAAYSHITLDPDGNSRSYSGLPEQPPLGPHSYRGRVYDDEELQIQLFSLKKILPGTQAARGPSTGEKIKINRSSGAQVSLKKKLATKQRKQTILTSQKGSLTANPSNNPSNFSHHLKEKSMYHIKNNKSNLLINISDMPSSLNQQHSNLAQSLSLKRLKTPKLKLKEELTTPPIERSTLQGFQLSSSNQNQQQRISQFQSVPPGMKTIVNIPGSAKNQQHQAILNYQNQQSQVGYKSPFVYAQTSKAGAAQQVSRQGNDMKVIDSRIREKSNSATHIKQKSLHIGNSQVQPIVATGQSRFAYNTRGGSVGSQLPPQAIQQKVFTLESHSVQTLLATKRDTDQAFETLKRKLSETRSLNIPSQHQLSQGPQMIQPTKNISTVTSGTTSSQMLPNSLQQNPQERKGGSSQGKAIPTLNAMNSSDVRPPPNLNAISDFERNYRKLTGLINKMFN